MGYYIEGPNNGKGNYLISQHGAREILQPVEFSDIPVGMSLVVVVENGLFEAAGYCYDENEFKAFTDTTDDNRLRRFYLMGENLCRQLCNYSPRPCEFSIPTQ